MDHEDEPDEEDQDDNEPDEDSEPTEPLDPDEVSVISKYLREGEVIVLVARNVKFKKTTKSIMHRAPEKGKIPMLVITKYNKGEGAARVLMLDKKYRPFNYQGAFSGGASVLESSESVTGMHVIILSPKWLFDSLSEKEEMESSRQEKSLKEQFKDEVRELKKSGYGFRHLDLATDLMRSPNYWLELTKVELNGSKLNMEAAGQSLPIKAKKGFGSAEDISLSMGKNDMRTFILRRTLKTNEFNIWLKSKNNSEIYGLLTKGLTEAQSM
jgi:hypothetical protein